VPRELAHDSVVSNFRGDLLQNPRFNLIMPMQHQISVAITEPEMAPQPWKAGFRR
jgi:hypothetical protein